MKVKWVLCGLNKEEKHRQSQNFGNLVKVALKGTAVSDSHVLHYPYL